MVIHKFCLKWTDFETNIQSSFRQVRISDEFTDVSLLCEDDEVKAHRLVLSSASEFFQTVLRRAKNPHPLIYLKGIKMKELQAVLDFIYNGEASIALEDLDTFFDATKELKIRGLLDKGEEENWATDQTKVHPPGTIIEAKKELSTSQHIVQVTEDVKEENKRRRNR